MLVRTREFESQVPVRAGSLLALPGFEVRHLTPDRLRLQIWGALPETWAAALSSGLYAAGLCIGRAWARRVEAESWLGEFELEAPGASDAPLCLDYLEFARRPLDALATPEPRVTRYHRSLTAKHGGSLFLEVRASDQPGFLGGLLSRIGALGVHPEEMIVDTRGVPVLDRFFLKDAYGRVPDPARRHALGTLLDQLARPRTSAIE